jgi:Na+-transporting NADH:ubiquinone oxidoreductase subunit NqrB
MKPLTLVLTTASVLLAAAIGVLIVLTSRFLTAAPYGGLEYAWLSIPVLLILLGAYKLFEGSNAARIGLGLVYALMTASFLFFSFFDVIVRTKPLSSVALPLVWATVLGVATLLLFFSRTLKAELRDIRQARKQN